MIKQLPRETWWNYVRKHRNLASFKVDDLLRYMSSTNDDPLTIRETEVNQHMVMIDMENVVNRRYQLSERRFLDTIP